MHHRQAGIVSGNLPPVTSYCGNCPRASSGWSRSATHGAAHDDRKTGCASGAGLSRALSSISRRDAMPFDTAAVPRSARAQLTVRLSPVRRRHPKSVEQRFLPSHRRSPSPPPADRSTRFLYSLITCAPRRCSSRIDRNHVPRTSTTFRALGLVQTSEHPSRHRANNPATSRPETPRNSARNVNGPKAMALPPSSRRTRNHPPDSYAPPRLSSNRRKQASMSVIEPSKRRYRNHSIKRLPDLPLRLKPRSTLSFSQFPRAQRRNIA